LFSISETKLREGLPYALVVAMSAVGKKLHHFVPRFYLRAWAEREKVYCLQDGQIQHRNIRNVCAENYFYRLQKLSPEDVGFLREVIRDSPEGLKASHEQLVRAFTLPYLAKRKLEASGVATSEAMAEIDRMITEINENLHTNIEEASLVCTRRVRTDRVGKVPANEPSFLLVGLANAEYETIFCTRLNVPCGTTRL
jgi:hypothetical protein